MKEIKLTQGYVTIVDDEDFESLNQFKWWAKVYKNGLVYAVRSCKGNKKILMHRHLLGIKDPLTVVDHKDRNSLNNQKVNLRTCNKSQNNSNRKSLPNSTSKYLGVHFSKSIKKWVACISKDNRNIAIGRYNSEIDAAKAYNRKALELKGEFANLNYI